MASLMGILAPLSQLLSTREDGLLMMVSVLAEYPLALLTRTWLYKQPQKVQHIVYATIGIALYLFNYGFAIYHSLLSTLLAYVIVNYFCEHYRCVVMAHACFLGHLMLAYWFAETDQYDINWTTPFCVMVLRYIGLVMDCYDGNKPADKLGSTEKKYAIKSPPDLLEVAAYGFFYAGTLVGPQFSLSRFRSFVNGEFLNEKGEVRDSGLLESLNRFIAGVFFTVVYMWGIVWISNDFFNTNDFYSMSLCWKTIWIVMWYRITMCRYLSAWLLSEGAAILAGLAYNGKDEKGNDLWDGVRDVRILRFWFGYSFQMQVSSFNCGTNNWAKRHIFKRLRWLGDKRISHIVTMTYLAVWHGYHLGYFMIFGLEFFSVLAVSQFFDIVDRIPAIKEFISQPWMQPINIVFGIVYCNVTMGLGFLTFGLVKTRVWLGPVKATYFIVYIIHMIIWPLVYFALDICLPKRKQHSDKSERSEKSK